MVSSDESALPQCRQKRAPAAIGAPHEGQAGAPGSTGGSSSIRAPQFRQKRAPSSAAAPQDRQVAVSCLDKLLTVDRASYGEVGRVRGAWAPGVISGT